MGTAASAHSAVHASSPSEYHPMLPGRPPALPVHPPLFALDTPSYYPVHTPTSTVQALSPLVRQWISEYCREQGLLQPRPTPYAPAEIQATGMPNVLGIIQGMASTTSTPPPPPLSPLHSPCLHVATPASNSLAVLALLQLQATSADGGLQGRFGLAQTPVGLSAANAPPASSTGRHSAAADRSNLIPRSKRARDGSARLEPVSPKRARATRFTRPPLDLNLPPAPDQEAPPAALQRPPPDTSGAPLRSGRSRTPVPQEGRPLASPASSRVLPISVNPEVPASGGGLATGKDMRRNLAAAGTHCKVEQPRASGGAPGVRAPAAGGMAVPASTWSEARASAWDRALATLKSRLEQASHTQCEKRRAALVQHYIRQFVAHSAQHDAPEGGASAEGYSAVSSPLTTSLGASAVPVLSSGESTHLRSEGRQEPQQPPAPASEPPTPAREAPTYRVGGPAVSGRRSAPSAGPPHVYPQLEDAMKEKGLHHVPVPRSDWSRLLVADSCGPEVSAVVHAQSMRGRWTA